MSKLNNKPYCEKTMKKNCMNCKNLEWFEDCDSDGHITTSGYMCDKQYQKAYERGEETKQENNMCRKSYLEKSKVCFEPKEAL